MKTISVDLSRARSTGEVIEILLLALGVRAASTWSGLAEGLRRCRTGRLLRLRGFHLLERSAPETAQRLLGVFGEHNSTPGATIQCLEVDVDYDAPVFFVVIQARQAPDDGASPRGAIVNCWIKDEDPARAEQRAIASLESAGWRVLSIDEHQPVARHDYEPESSGEQFLKQAYIDGEVYDFHSWVLPVDLSS